MAIGKLFIGRKVRELRAASNATQSQFAERIGISTSYLNQIENNQRPVSATVLLSLADKFQLDIAELSTGETDRLLSALAEALSDPLFEAYAPSLQELKLVTQNAPGLAHALITCHQAYRRNGKQLATAPATSPNGIARPSCNSHASAQPVRSGTRIRLSKRRGASSASLPRRRTGCGGFRTHPAGFALALGFEISYAEAFVYAGGLNLANRAGFDSVGISCRICERPNCTSRAVPPFRRKISVDDNRRETTRYKLR